MNSRTDDTLTHLVETCNKMWSEYVPFRINHFLKLILCHLRAIESHHLTKLIRKLKMGHDKVIFVSESDIESEKSKTPDTDQH